MIGPITADEMGRAVNAGSPVRMGLPAHVSREDASIAILDLAARHRGQSDPYHITRTGAPGLAELSTALDRTLILGGMPISGEDLGHADRALALAPGLGERHAHEANARRLSAGQAALRISDAMVRGRMLDLVDGWTAIAEASTIIDDDDAENGVLYHPAAELMLTCRVLLVRCPSTFRRYALLVPAEMASAREARLWTLAMSSPPEVES